MIKKIGKTLVFLGVASAVVHFFDVELRVLSWINHWGAASGWGIRGALVFTGGVMLFLENFMGDEGLEGEVKK